MAKNNANLKKTGEAARVHKATEVHKRRAAGHSAAARSGDAPTREESSFSEYPSESEERFVALTNSETQRLDMPISDGEELEPEAGAEVESEIEAESEEESGPRKPLRKKIVGIVACLIVAAALVFVGYLGGSRWIRYNDEADMQGSWYVYGTNVPLTFANGSIAINAETSYAYHIDPIAKTIEYSLGNLAGQGRYWFNDKRNILVITDGTDYTMWSTLTDDLAYGVRHVFGETELPTGENSIVLSREIVQAPVTSGEQAGEAGKSETASETGEASGDSGKETTDMLSVSDIMVEDENASSNG